MIKASEFADKFIKIATEYKTLYVMGCFGAPITEKIAKRYISGHSYNQKPERQKMINDAIDTECFGFDCICLIKGVLWGWSGDLSHIYGGAVYRSNNVNDINLNLMLNSCSEVSEDFSRIEKGEYLWMDGHCGIYVGDGLAVEATPKWDNKVQLTAVGNIGKKEGYNVRSWKKHGKLPYVDYSTAAEEEESETISPETDDTEIKLPQTIDKSIIKRILALIIKYLNKLYNSL